MKKIKNKNDLWPKWDIIFNDIDSGLCIKRSYMYILWIYFLIIVFLLIGLYIITYYFFWDDYWLISLNLRIEYNDNFLYLLQYIQHNWLLLNIISVKIINIYIYNFLILNKILNFINITILLWVCDYFYLYQLVNFFCEFNYGFLNIYYCDNLYYLLGSDTYFFNYFSSVLNFDVISMLFFGKYNNTFNLVLSNNINSSYIYDTLTIREDKILHIKPILQSLYWIDIWREVDFYSMFNNIEVFNFYNLSQWFRILKKLKFNSMLLLDFNFRQKWISYQLLLPFINYLELFLKIDNTFYVFDWKWFDREYTVYSFLYNWVHFRVWSGDLTWIRRFFVNWYFSDSFMFLSNMNVRNLFSDYLRDIKFIDIRFLQNISDFNNINNMYILNCNFYYNHLYVSNLLLENFKAVVDANYISGQHFMSRMNIYDTKNSDLFFFKLPQFYFNLYQIIVDFFYDNLYLMHIYALNIDNVVFNIYMSYGLFNNVYYYDVFNLIDIFWMSDLYFNYFLGKLNLINENVIFMSVAYS